MKAPMARAGGYRGVGKLKTQLYPQGASSKNDPCLPRQYYSATANFNKLSGGTRLAVHSSTRQAPRIPKFRIINHWHWEGKKRITDVFFNNALIASATAGGADILCCSFGHSEFRGFDNLLLCLLPTGLFY